MQKFQNQGEDQQPATDNAEQQLVADNQHETTEEQQLVADNQLENTEEQQPIQSMPENNEQPVEQQEITPGE